MTASRSNNRLLLQGILVTSPLTYLKLLLALLLLFTAHGVAMGRQELPVVKANSTTVDIQDGNHLLKGYWTILPNQNLDVYYAKRDKNKKRVTFRTDIDSISFDVEPGQNYDFNILLKNRYLCHTQISTLRRSYQRISKKSPLTPDEIPFTLGRDGKIHIKGKINDSSSLDFMFDTGADTIVLYPSAFAKKVNMDFDGVTENSGFGGVSTRQTSHDNRLEISNLKWDHEGVMYIKKQADSADGIIGFNVFEDKVVKIDYDRELITIYDSLPKMAEIYINANTRTQGTLPQIKATLTIGKNSVTDWFVFDTGSNSSLHLNHEFATKNKLYGTMARIGTSRSGGVGKREIANEVVLLPELTIGGIQIHNIPINQEMLPVEEFTSQSHLGMDVLKRFNTILDYQKNQIYLQPNGLIATPFRRNIDPRIPVVAVLTTGLSALLVTVFVLLKRRQKRSATISKVKQQDDSCAK